MQLQLCCLCWQHLCAECGGGAVCCAARPIEHSDVHWLRVVTRGAVGPAAAASACRITRRHKSGDSHCVASQVGLPYPPNWKCNICFPTEIRAEIRMAPAGSRGAILKIRTSNITYPHQFFRCSSAGFQIIRVQQYWDPQEAPAAQHAQRRGKIRCPWHPLEMHLMP